MAKTKTKGTAKTVSDTPVPQPITIRSTNPKIMADNILKLEESIKAADVSANPSGTAEDTLLSTIGIDGKKYDLGPSAENTSYDNTDSELTADDVQGAIDEVQSAIDDLDKYVKANTLSAGDSITIDSTDFIPITMLADGYVTIYTLTSGGTDSIDIALNTAGTNLVRLGTANGSYQFGSLFARKGTTIYIKASAANIGGYFLTTLS